MKKYYITTTENQTYTVSEKIAQAILDNLNSNNTMKYMMIPVEEGIKNKQKVFSRSLDLNKILSINEVEVYENFIEIIRLEPLGESFVNIIYDMKLNEEDFSLSNFHTKTFNISTKMNIPSENHVHITTYTNCLFIDYRKEGKNKLYKEVITLSYENINFSISEVNKVEKINHESLPKFVPIGRPLLTSDFVSVYINNILLGLVQSFKVDDTLIASSDS